jgi:hypothetical protein
MQNSSLSHFYLSSSKKLKLINVNFYPWLHSIRLAVKSHYQLHFDLLSCHFTLALPRYILFYIIISNIDQYTRGQKICIILLNLNLNNILIFHFILMVLCCRFQSNTKAESGKNNKKIKAMGRNQFLYVFNTIDIPICIAICHRLLTNNSN